MMVRGRCKTIVPTTPGNYRIVDFGTSAKTTTTVPLTVLASEDIDFSKATSDPAVQHQITITLRDYDIKTIPACRLTSLYEENDHTEDGVNAHDDFLEKQMEVYESLLRAVKATNEDALRESVAGLPDEFVEVKHARQF
jgi:hypothetical protein